MVFYLFSLLGLGFLLGLQHAFDADHLAAVTTLVAEQKSIKQSSLLGAFWGLGHALSLLAAGILILILKIRIPDSWALSLESAVGAMLVFLGARLLVRMRREKIHVHKHAHDGTEHIHFHSHAAGEEHHHTHRTFWQSLFIGMTHGLAGSAAITLLVLSTIPSISMGMIYILIFGLGSVFGMMVVSSFIALPLRLFPKAHVALKATAGMMSIALGLNILFMNL